MGDRPRFVWPSSEPECEDPGIEGFDTFCVGEPEPSLWNGSGGSIGTSRFEAAGDTRESGGEMDEELVGDRPSGDLEGEEAR